MYEIRPREYVYKQTKKRGIFNTRASRLADPEEGSAVKSWRQQQVLKAHLPVDLWKKKVPVDDSDWGILELFDIQLLNVIFVYIFPSWRDEYAHFHF